MMTQTITIDTPFIRLDDFLKWIGLAESGGQAKHRIQQGGFTVNGDICTQRGKKLRDGDTVQAVGDDHRYVVAVAQA